MKNTEYERKATCLNSSQERNPSRSRSNFLNASSTCIQSPFIWVYYYQSKWNLKLLMGFILMHWSSQKGMCSWIKFEQLTEYFAKKKVWFACVHKIDCDLSVEHSLIKKVILTGFNERWLGSVEVICQMWHAHYAEHSLFNQL